VLHTTRYRYASAVSLCQNEVRLAPRDLPGQRCLYCHLDIVPEPADLRTRYDSYGNRVDYFAVERRHQELEISASSEVEVLPTSPELDFSGAVAWNQVRERVRAGNEPALLEARDALYASPQVPQLRSATRYALVSFTRGRPLMEALRHLMARIHAEFAYEPGFTNVATPLEAVFRHRRGVCQDFAHLAIACLRAIGLPARYISGYLETEAPPGQDKLVGVDATHAWCSVYLPGGTWVDFDPTNNQLPGERYITLAMGRDYGDVAPVKGIVLSSGEHELDVSVDVRRLGK
jgi:transglutaminase-like putative cysteine protease